MSSSSPVIRLSCKSQSYDWGKLGSDSKVAQLAASCPEFKSDAALPYAELWMGTHPNGASVSKDSPARTPLRELLTKQNLGTKIHDQYGGDLPFLFKVLSIRKALSIQAHPDKQLAADLHGRFPDIYKDPNHKPEMAVALTPFEAFINFRPLQEIREHLREFPEFRALIGDETAAAFEAHVDSKDGDNGKNKGILKALFKRLMESEHVAIEKQLDILIKRIHAEKKLPTNNNNNNNTASAAPVNLYELVDRLNTQFPNDVGSFCAFLLNYVQLQPGESIFLAANEPHAYLSGDCVECMAASDNVIRSGLTPKFKDVDTLVNCLTYNHGPAHTQIMRGVPYQTTKHTVLYDPPIDEFAILRTILAEGERETVDKIEGPSIMVVTEGNGALGYVNEEGKEVEVRAHRGYVFFIGAGCRLSLTGAANNDQEHFTVYRAFCA
ncbi:Mannose-6-phosphate isomerase [Geranomyces michiganensis]|nr:Mannose-6-phosphate isomerase [Geranomyces michiganensis]